MQRTAAREWAEQAGAEIEHRDRTRASWDRRGVAFTVPEVAIRDLLICIKDLMAASGKTWAELCEKFPQHVVAMDAAERSC
jgi:hypothetical protein